MIRCGPVGGGTLREGLNRFRAPSLRNDGGTVVTLTP